MVGSSIALATIVVALFVLRQGPTTPIDAVASPAAVDPCSVTAKRKLSRSEIRLCDSVAVTLTLDVTCSEPPLDLVLVLDHSASMVRAWSDVIDLASKLIMVQSSREQRDVRFGLVDHATANLIAARIVQELTPDTKRVLNAINRLDDAGGADNLPDGIDVAARMLQQ